MEISHLIRTKEEYKTAVNRIDVLFHAKPGTHEGDEVELLILLVRKYDEEHNPIPDPEPIEYIKFLMEQKGLKQKDLVQYIGNKGAVSKILNHKKQLTLEMIRNLKHGLGISADALIV